MTRLRLLAIACLAACTATSAAPQRDPPREPPPPPTRLASPTVASYHMRRHFDDLRRIEQLLVSGQLDEGTTVAQLLVAQEPDPELARFAVQSQRVANAALALTKVHAIDEALRAEVRVASACADCHVATRATPHFAPAPPLPADGPDAPERMARHVWAADRLWEGVIGADDERWTSGLRVLARAPLPLAPMTDAPALGTRLQLLAAIQLQARPTTLLEDRATAYGEILVTCAACHRSLQRIASRSFSMRQMR